MKKLTIAAGCSLLGGSGCLFVVEHIDHARRYSNGQMLLLILLLGSLIVCMVGFVAFLGWRDDRNARKSVPPPEKPPGSDPADE